MKNWSLHFFINNTISPCAGFPLRFVWVGVESDSVWTPPKLGLGVSGGVQPRRTVGPCVWPVRRGMSRHSTLVKIGGVELVVVAGWDRPLQYFFLDVETPERGDDDDAVYASMYDSRLFGASRGGPERLVGGLGWDELRERLAEL